MSWKELAVAITVAGLGFDVWSIRKEVQELRETVTTVLKIQRATIDVQKQMLSRERGVNDLTEKKSSP